MAYFGRHTIASFVKVMIDLSQLVFGLAGLDCRQSLVSDLADFKEYSRSIGRRLRGKCQRLRIPPIAKAECFLCPALQKNVLHSFILSLRNSFCIGIPVLLISYRQHI